MDRCLLPYPPNHSYGRRIFQLQVRDLNRERSSQTLGQYLKREREARNVSLEELSHGTRINRPFLEALERNDFNFFSQKEFVLGFLKRYARFISLDEQDVLRRFSIEIELVGRNEKFEQMPLFMGAPPAAEKAGEGETEIVEIPRRAGGKGKRKVWLQFIILGIAVSLTFYLNYMIKEREKLEEKRQVEGIEKKEERAENRKKEESMEEPSIAPNRLNASDQGKKEVLNKKRSGLGKAASR